VPKIHLGPRFRHKHACIASTAGQFLLDFGHEARRGTEDFPRDPLESELLATKTGTGRETTSAAGIEQGADIEVCHLSPETVRKLPERKFNLTHRRRVTALSKKAQAAILLSAEQCELLRVRKVLHAERVNSLEKQGRGVPYFFESR